MKLRSQQSDENLRTRDVSSLKRASETQPEKAEKKPRIEQTDSFSKTLQGSKDPEEVRLYAKEVVKRLNEMQARQAHGFTEPPQVTTKKGREEIKKIFI